MPPEAAPVILTLLPFVMLVAEIFELFVSALLTVSVNSFAFTVPALSLALI